jgi:hypothetical protein
MLVINDTLLATKSPVMVSRLSMLMLSVVPVAIATLPEKVLQDARAVASPEFWMVVVPETLHDAAVEGTSQHGGSMMNLYHDDDI